MNLWTLGEVYYIKYNTHVTQQALSDQLNLIKLQLDDIERSISDIQLNRQIIGLKDGQVYCIEAD